MTASVTFDASQVRRLQARIEGIPTKVIPTLVVVGDKAAAQIQRDLRSKARGHRHFPSFPASITTDRRGLHWEIGADKQRKAVARLANILYFGTSKNGPVLEAPGAALDRQAPKLVKAVQAAAKALTDEIP